VSFWDRLFGFGKEIVLLSAKTEQLSRNVENLTKLTTDHDRRLVRIETLIDIAKYQAHEKRGRLE
jgi:hypothetical protein